MGHKRVDIFNDIEKFLEYRRKKVGSAGFDDSWVLDKKWRKENVDGFFSCKWCAQELHSVDYRPGELLLSCRKPLCPGNIDSGMAEQIKKHQFDIREQTNQYLFNSRMKF